MKTPHRSVRQGMRVLVLLRNGQRLEAKFLAFNDRYLSLEGYDKIPASLIRSVGIYKGAEYVRAHS